MKKQMIDPMSEAALQGDVKTIASLLSQEKSKPDKKVLNEALSHSVKGGHVACVARLLKAGADPDTTISSNCLLGDAADDGDLEIVKLLVKAGANIHRKVAGVDPFASALEMEHVKVASFLKAHGADWPTSTLRYACQQGDLKLAKSALQSGADFESTGGIFEESPLMVAAGQGHAKIVRLLLKQGADPNQRVQGKTALHDAAQNGGSLETINALVEAGANIHAHWEGETVLMAAAGSGDLPIVKRLVELGAKVETRDKHRGMTALDHAKSSKNKGLIAYLNSLGAVSDRDQPRGLARTLAKTFGGKPVEHSAGFTFNAKFHGISCQFNIRPDAFSLYLQGLDFGHKEFKRSKDAQLLFASTKPAHEKLAAIKTSLSGLLTFRTLSALPLAVPFVKTFCARHREAIQQMKLGQSEIVRLGNGYAGFYCPSIDGSVAEQRLAAFARLIQKVSRPPQPARQMFEREWLLKPASKLAANSSAHSLGGKPSHPVGCPHCGCTTNLMAQIDLSDSSLSKTSLGRSRLPVFWCLSCLEWDPAFFDLSGPAPRPLPKGKQKAKAATSKHGEPDLPAQKLTLVPVAAGKKAGRKSKIGGKPAWIQSEETPGCPQCEQPMAFCFQLASDSRISYCDMGMLYAFACPSCKITASLIQSH